MSGSDGYPVTAAATVTALNESTINAFAAIDHITLIAACCDRIAVGGTATDGSRNATSTPKVRNVQTIEAAPKYVDQNCIIGRTICGGARLSSAKGIRAALASLRSREMGSGTSISVRPNRPSASPYTCHRDYGRQLLSSRPQTLGKRGHHRSPAAILQIWRVRQR